ncbi:branched-chain amino acid aminotransferase [Paenibacillus macquariensis]|uniref:Branched-chain-amino-acid aminotransferase n=1 Tax=Paenibacillus macquariensis TaxID=948756 RepID=A0ABY1JVP8_9BACL|nr:branched-chain amino acid aminotransferase [Paenibacillus macquariensis]MEC0090697.1 branched-chain amino acid aminotransferase [Paenibacillus macquariensis]OAB34449.1 branched chain amino acid aminotransferase [Paenibacillus macquariensis subsp. macquariensis]SIQ85946.1 branched-chain amino acid aminotransferase [Paenibacillus macquariensis]
MKQHLDIHMERSAAKKTKPTQDQLGFGIHFTDHMFMMDYRTEKGWHHARIVPYQPIVLDPAAKVFHYGQTVFEGLKAYKTEDRRILLFRPQKNMQRLNRSNERLSIPPINESFALDALKQLISIDQDWIPIGSGTSLYIRPFVIATQPELIASPSSHFQFIIIMSPVGPYYAEGLNPVKIYVESTSVRAVIGGMGEAKTAANYAASLKAQEDAKQNGYAQVLWLDGVHHKYIEEVGSMNVFFKIKGIVYTPALKGSILDGVTRDSILQLLQHWNIPVVTGDISIEEVYEASREGTLEEAFGTGTAAVISPIGELYLHGQQLVIQNGQTGELSNKLYQTLTGIQNGALPDLFHWMIEVNTR